MKVSLPDIDATRKNKTWKKVYHHKCIHNPEINDSVSTTVTSWRNIKTTQELGSFFKVHPHHGLITLQESRPVMLHSITAHDDDPTLYVGSFGLSMLNDPVQFQVTGDMLRRFQQGKPKPGKNKDQDQDQDDTSNQSKGSKNDKNQPNILRFNNIFLVPPVHVHQILACPKGTLKSLQSFSQWINTKYLSGKGPSPKELEPNGAIRGYSHYWLQLQQWVQGVEGLHPNNRCSVKASQTEEDFPTDSYYLTHVPQALWIMAQKEETEDTEGEDEPVIIEKDADILGQAVATLGDKMGNKPPYNPDNPTDDTNPDTTEEQTQDDEQEDGNEEESEEEPEDTEDEDADDTDESQDSPIQVEQSKRSKHKTKSSSTSNKKPKNSSSTSFAFSPEMFAQFMMMQSQTLQQMHQNNERSQRNFERAQGNFEAMIRTNSETLAQLTSIRVTQESSEATTTKESTALWTKLLDTQQLALARGSAAGPGNEPDEPIPFIIELYAHKQKTLAKTLLENKMADLRSKYHPAVTANLVLNGPLWSTPTEPERLTIFAFHPMEEQFTANKKTSMLATLQSEFEIKVDKEDIQQLYHQDLYFPIDTYNFLHMIDSYAGLLKIFFGPNSYVATNIREYSERCQLRFSEFSDLANKQGHQAYSKVLYSLDVAVQTFLRKLGDPKRSFHKTAWINLATAISNLEVNLEGQTYLNISLPTTFTSLLKEFMNKHGVSDKQGKKK